MIRTEYSSRYLSERKRFLKHNPKLLKKSVKALKLFSQNPKHPGLHLEKIKGKTVWSIRVDQANRIFFIWANKKIAILLGIGPHDKYRDY